MGRNSQALGSSLENYLDMAHGYYRRQGLCLVLHNGVKGMFRRTKRETVFVPSPDKSAPDYYGCYKGLFLAFDAKSTMNKTTWRLHRDREHQYIKLMDLSDHGAVTWFAVEQRVTETLFLLPINSKSPYPSLKFEDHDDSVLLVKFDPKIGSYNWLEAINTHWLNKD